MRRLAFVSTCSEAGWRQYGERFVDSFIEFFPPTSTLYFYVDFKVPVTHPRVVFRQLAECPGLDLFQSRISRMPFATGDVVVSYEHKHGHHPQIIWNARKFSFKVFSVEHAVLNAKEDVLSWIDADTVAFRRIPASFLSELMPRYCMLGYLGRKNLYAECGYVSYNLHHPATKHFVRTVADLYRKGIVFGMKEWHDSYVWDLVRFSFEQKFGVSNFDISYDVGELGHVFINSALGQYLDHMKGPRKDQGRSRDGDLRVDHGVAYWKKDEASSAAVASVEPVRVGSEIMSVGQGTAPLPDDIADYRWEPYA